jgi:hypothetical protein
MRINIAVNYQKRRGILAISIWELSNMRGTKTRQ